MEGDLRLDGNEIPPLDAPRLDPMQMQAQLAALTELVRGLVTVVERLDGRNSMPPLEDAPRPQGPAVMENPNHGEHPHVQEGTGESEHRQGLPRPRPTHSSGSQLRAAGIRAIEELPQNLGGNSQGDLGSVQAGSQAKGGSIVQRSEAPGAASSAVSTEKARTLMERMANLERRLTGDVAG